MSLHRAVLHRTSQAATFAVLSAFALLLGCGTATTVDTHTTTTPAAARSLTGHVHGGQQPIAGAVIQLYAVGITGVQSAATPLIAATVTTDQGGNFNITGDWNCTSNTATYGVNPLLYIVASGGNPGLSSGTNNTAINLVAALGPCSSIGASTSISLNELTTVAAAYALAPFMADVAHVGATGANAVGLVNAFNTASLLVNWSTGVAPGNLLPSTATAPVAELNTLADALAACVNSTGAGGACSALFSAATPAGGTAPSDIVGVILNIAANPALNATTFYKMASTTPPFQPVLAAVPNDWTVALKFTGGGLNAPTGVALDAAGDVWIANAGGNGVTELSPAGVQLTGTTGYTGSGNILGAQGIAVDTTGNVWIADTLLSSVVELSVANGAVQSSASYTSGGISGPIGIAIDSQNNIWVANYTGASVTELNSTGTPVGGSPLTANAQLQAPYGIAIDTAGKAWVTDNLDSVVVEFSSDQSLLSANGLSDDTILAPKGVAIDASGRTWVAYQGTNAASYYSSGLNNVISPSPYTGGGLSMPTAVAIDGQGTVWVTNNLAAGSLSKLVAGQSTPLSPAAGLGSLHAPSGIAIDASGSIWTTNTGDNSVAEFVGIAYPASMPLVAKAGP
jgi:sugar lactone lactonase YvrE